MKFHVKNRFIYNGIKKQIGEVVEVSPDKINELQRMNVIDAPVKELKIETAVIKPIENEMIDRNRKKVLDTSHFPIPKLRPKNIKKKGKK